MDESTLIARAERAARRRATLLLLLAAILIGSELLALESVERPGPLLGWMALVALAAAALSPLGGRVLPRRVQALLEDEGANANRREGLVTGFWVAMAAALVVVAVALYAPLSGPVVARVIVTAGLAAALIGFALRERQAAR